MGIDPPLGSEDKLSPDSNQTSERGLKPMLQIRNTAKGIFDARVLFSDSSLADLYDPLAMPTELRKAHTLNDIAVMHAYGFSTKVTESDCVAELMKMYQQLVKEACE